MSILWAYAHPKEAEGLELPDALELGVGKIEASLALTRRLCAGLPEVVVNFGVAGVFPDSGLDVGDVCLVTEETLADEGVVTLDGFANLVELKLAERNVWTANADWAHRLSEALGEPRWVRGTTVSTISGADDVAAAYAERVSPVVESMEGAAVARVCEVFGVPWVQVRSISNRVGERSKGGWDIRRAKATLHDAVRTLIGSL